MTTGKDTTDKAIAWNPGDEFGRNAGGQIVKVPAKLRKGVEEDQAPSVEELENQPGDDNNGTTEKS